MIAGENERGVLFKVVKYRDVEVERVPIRRNRGMDEVASRCRLYQQ